MTIKVLDDLERNLKDPGLLDEVGPVAVSRIQNRINRGEFTPNSALTQATKGSSKPLRDRGQLIASISHRIEVSKIVLGTNHPAASILNNGGTITPKSSKYLALPAGNRVRGLMRTYGLTPRACIAGMKAGGYNVWPYFGTGTPVILACLKTGKSKPFTLFILKRSVTIPARPFMILDDLDMKILYRTALKRILR